MKYCTKMGLCAWRSLLNGRASCVSTEPCELAVASENDAQQLQAKIAALANEIEQLTKEAWMTIHRGASLQMRIENAHQKMITSRNKAEFDYYKELHEKLCKEANREKA